MANNDPQGPTPGPPGDPELPDEDALRRLERRLDRASEAAERLIAEAAARAASPLERLAEEVGHQEAAADDTEAADHAEAGSEPPPAGWQRRGASTDGEVDLLLHVLSSLRDRIPPELQRRLGEALREVLLALRALIDWYLERSERRRTEPAEVQDIPIL